jgi:hypothetical protein
MTKTALRDMNAQTASVYPYLMFALLALIAMLRSHAWMAFASLGSVFVVTMTAALKTRFA